MSTLIIVGASVAGVRTAQALRMQGYGEPITLVGAEPHCPYDKPPLSKEMLAPDNSGDPIPLLSKEELASLDVDLRLSTRIVAVDTGRRHVITDQGETLAFTDLVIATGVTPRTLPGADSLKGIFTIRNADDAAGLRVALGHSKRVVVIGAGFIGAEFASAARDYGARVTIVELQRTPMEQLLGAEIGEKLARLHTSHGATLHTGVGFSHFEGNERVNAVVLSDGTVLPADLVVIGIGAEPSATWLDGSGIPVVDGVECDRNLRVIGHAGIYAAGDIARWLHPLYESPIRIEHWTNANEHGMIVAAAITGNPAPKAQIPYVWSDQYGKRFQIVGRPGDGVLAFIRGDIDDEPLVAIYADPADRVVGAFVVDDPRTLMQCRRAIAKGLTLDELNLDPSRSHKPLTQVSGHRVRSQSLKEQNKMALTDEGIIDVPGMASRWVRLGGGAKAHYTTAGDSGPAVLLLHGGLPGSSGTAGWRWLAPYLAENGFRVYCPDMPGFGLSDTNKEHWPEGLHSHVDFIHEFTTAIGLDKFHISGNSMGCMNSVNYTLAHPERILSFVLIAGGVGDIEPSALKPKSKIELTKYDGTKDGMRRMMEAIIYRDEAISDDLIEMRYQAANSHLEAHAQLWPSIQEYGGNIPWRDPNIAARLSTKGRLDKLTTPGVYLYGQDDVLTPVEWGYEQEDVLPNIQFFYPAECGHQGQTDRPDLFNPLYLEFFRDGTISRQTADAAGISKRREELSRLVEQV
jgi:2-hydroxy-6-oxonona-2,4-dienedioate hydrolase